MTTTATGPSTECRLGNHKTCARLSMRCACDCHGGIQMPPTRKTATVTPITSRPRTTAAPDLTIVWEEPRPKTRGGRNSLVERLQPALDQLRAKPGAWARIASYESKSAAGSAAKSMRKRTPGFEFEARNGDGHSRLYARFVGDHQDA